ncbi:hypothetical protein K6119_18910 [Paracrocinitomix mangrovi]|uniref:hypothetical protein n=1 Tax=Paracrocinitomix mangrovi TaxID=2862509 RepID=UPI001C8DF58D|nr:hypothetical protein [Paracrocinitomix mangrovi]UKN01797.1 hypothetical protein K6119_18910 [Paracrocinitomix mangrovi]
MKKSLFYLSVFGALIMFQSCNKNGCTNPEADNYNPDAKSEDFSCAYTGNVFFWCNPQVSDSLNSLGHSILRFEVGGDIVDSTATVSFASVAGDCGGVGVMTIPQSFTGNNEWKYKWRVKGDNFVTLYEGFVTIPGGDCAEVELGYP